jgi:hypothetical protein
MKAGWPLQVSSLKAKIQLSLPWTQFRLQPPLLLIGTEHRDPAGLCPRAQAGIRGDHHHVHTALPQGKRRIQVISVVTASHRNRRPYSKSDRPFVANRQTVAK